MAMGALLAVLESNARWDWQWNLFMSLLLALILSTILSFC